MSLELDIPIRVDQKKVKERKKKNVAPKELTVESAREPQLKENTAPVRRRTSKRVRRNRKIALLLAVSLGIAGWYALVGPGARVVVPSIVGATLEEAQSSLTPLGLNTEVAEKRFDEDIAAGKVIDSKPSGGGKIDPGGTVTIVLSKGKERYQLPVLTGLTPEAAFKSIASLPLKTGTVVEEFNSTVPNGFVISSNPGSDVKLKRDTVINLLVSKGIEQAELPIYLGKSGEQALNELTDLGFDVTSTFEFSETVPMGAVITQNPATAQAPKGGVVALVISKGSHNVFIPNLNSIEESKAIAALKDLNLKVVVKKIGKKPLKYVINMVPKFGTKVARGSTVTITVG